MKTKIHIGQHWQCKECLHNELIRAYRFLMGQMTEEEMRKYLALKTNRIKRATEKQIKKHHEEEAYAGII